MDRFESLGDLLRWDEQESFYRDWHAANDLGREALLANEGIPQEYKDNVTNPLGIDPRKTEERFFATGRNVMLVKHPRFLPFFSHSHDFFEMVCVLSGSCLQVFGSERRNLMAGDVCLIAPGGEHGIEVSDESLVVNVLLRSSTFTDIFQHAVRDKGPVASFFLNGVLGKGQGGALLFHTAGSDLVRDTTLDMYAEQAMLDEYSDRIVCSLVTVFLARLTRGYAARAEHLGAKEPTEGIGAEMFAYVIAHAREVTLDSLAAAFHYSAPYCSKVVRASTGMTFSQILLHARIQKGMALLAGSQLPVAQIADQVGYKSPETFIRAFERTLGRTPSEYRRASDLSEVINHQLA